MKDLRETVIIVILFTCVILSTSRNLLWCSPLPIWSDTVAKSPQKSRVHNNLGMSYVLIGKRLVAIDEFRKAIAIDRYLPAYYNLASHVDKLGSRDEARWHYGVFCQYAPPFVDDRKKACERFVELGGVISWEQSGGVTDR